MSRIALVILIAIAPGANVFAQFAMGTSFTYQGSLNDGGTPANGSYDFEFRLWDDPEAGTQHGPTQSLNATPVTSGLFNVALDFGDEFDGDPRWLQISVRSAGGGAFTTLMPRVELSPVPYALAAASVTDRIDVRNDPAEDSWTNRIKVLASVPAEGSGLHVDLQHFADAGFPLGVSHGVYSEARAVNPAQIYGVRGRASHTGSGTFADGFRQIVGTSGEAFATSTSEVLAVGLAGVAGDGNMGANVGVFSRAHRGGIVDAGIAALAGMGSGTAQGYLIGMMLALGGADGEVGGLFSASNYTIPAPDVLAANREWAIYATGPVGMFGLNPALGGEAPVVVDAATGELRAGPPGAVDLDADPTNELQDLSSMAAGTDRTINISGGTGTTFSVADDDNSATNELQGLADVLGMSGNGGGISAVNLGGIGIGTPAPDTPLHIVSATLGEDDGLKITQAGGNSLIYHNSGSDLVLRKLSAADQLVLDSGGSVGIGTAAPTAPLDVAGTVRIRGGMPAAGRVLTATDSAGNASWENAGAAPFATNFNSTFDSVDAGASNTWVDIGHTAGSLALQPGDRVYVSSSFRFETGPGSGTDNVAFRFVADDGGACSDEVSGGTGTLDWQHRDAWQLVSFHRVISITCAGTYDFRVQVETSSSDDEFFLAFQEITAFRL